MAKSVTFRIEAKPSRLFHGDIDVTISGKGTSGDILMTEESWRAFRSGLMPSAIADFELTEEDTCQTKRSKS